MNRRATEPAGERAARALRIIIVTPALRGSHAGNRTTAERWSRILRGLGHRVTVTQAWRGQACDVLVALHARKSYDSIARFCRTHPDRALIVALTGTDLYGDLRKSPRVRRALELADRLVLLQPLGRAELPGAARGKARIIFQSVEARARAVSRTRRAFDVCVLAHLRPVKDPFRTALASRLLPGTSRIRVLQVGAALDAKAMRNAQNETERNTRYIWFGDLPRAQALRVLARSRVLVISSRLEGGANAVSEALANGVPVLASRIPGNVGLLGANYPGYFGVGATRELADLMNRAESDPVFLSKLEACCKRRQRLVTPRREAQAWGGLLRELCKRRACPRRLW